MRWEKIVHVNSKVFGALQCTVQLSLLIIEPEMWKSKPLIIMNVRIEDWLNERTLFMCTVLKSHMDKTIELLTDL